jgi:hypothetical protein
MWPRELFDLTIENEGRKKAAARVLDTLQKTGVYVLYRNDEPYYVGQATKLRHRLWQHATDPNSRYFNFWNYFSAFVVDKERVDEVEAILISAMPTANHARPKIERRKLPPDVVRVLREIRRARVTTAGKPVKATASKPDRRAGAKLER